MHWQRRSGRGVMDFIFFLIFGAVVFGLVSNNKFYIQKFPEEKFEDHGDLISLYLVIVGVIARLVESDRSRQDVS